MRMLKRCMEAVPALLALLLLCVPPHSDAQQQAPAVAPGEVGVEEKLGLTIPLEIQLKDEEGKPVTIGSIVDRPVILTLNYFRCAGICTPLLNGVVEMLNEIPLAPGKDFKVITVSFDDRDTPDIAFRKRINYLKQMERPFPPDAWRFLTGDAASTRKLCDAVGFTFKQQGNDFIHAGVIVLLSPKGMITRYMYGVTFLPADVEMAVREAAKGLPQPTVNKFLQFCYSYDPQGRRYVLDITRIVGAGMLLVGAAVAVVLFLRSRRRSGAGGAS